MALVSIVMVSCGGGYWQACLDSIMRQTHKDIEVIVIDNSTKNLLSQEIKSKYPSIQIYSEEKNIFYSDSLNKGIALSKGAFNLCLNDDVVLEDTFLVKALPGFIDGQIGMVSGKIMRMDRRNIDSCGLSVSLFATAREKGYGIEDRGKFQSVTSIFGVNGAVAFYRRQALDECAIDKEYFDQDFRMFYEDLDIAWRMQNLGWRGRYIPEAIAYHARGATTRGDSGVSKGFARRYLNDELLWDLIKNRYLTLIKNAKIITILWRIPFLLVYDFLAFLHILFRRPRMLKRLFSHPIPFKSAFKKRVLLKEKILKKEKLR